MVMDYMQFWKKNPLLFWELPVFLPLLQNQKENANRQYADFIQYYEKAKDLCADTPEGSQDVEMQLLDSLYNQLEEGGWLK